MLTLGLLMLVGGKQERRLRTTAEHGRGGKSTLMNNSLSVWRSRGIIVGRRRAGRRHVDQPRPRMPSTVRSSATTAWSSPAIRSRCSPD